MDDIEELALTEDDLAGFARKNASFRQEVEGGDEPDWAKAPARERNPLMSTRKPIISAEEARDLLGSLAKGDDDLPDRGTTQERIDQIIAAAEEKSIAAVRFACGARYGTDANLTPPSGEDYLDRMDRGAARLEAELTRRNILMAALFKDCCS
ncbi:hypothetical protein FACS1894186_1080 [Alphaproteobacteria bacterium]|nr:hypothetical protein FACS1894186_1080 [Alphaproteobacteria bacterium]